MFKGTRLDFQNDFKSEFTSKQYTKNINYEMHVK